MNPTTNVASARTTAPTLRRKRPRHLAPVLLLSCVLACDILTFEGAAPARVPQLADGLLAMGLIASAISAAANVITFVRLELLRTSWACRVQVGVQFLAFVLLLGDLLLRLGWQSAGATLPYGLALTGGALALSLLTSRLAGKTSATLVWDDGEDWSDA